MLLLNKTLLRLSKPFIGLIAAIVCVRFAVLVSVTNFASEIAGSLGQMFDPSFSVSALYSSVVNAVWITVMILIGQLIQGELEYRCAAGASKYMRRTVFEKVLELDSGYIEKIGPVSAVTASVDAVESMQIYCSQYLPALLFSVAAPVYMFFRLRRVSVLIACILLGVSLILLPVNNLFRYRIENQRKKYWSSLEDMTGYYLDGIRGLTTLKLFDRDQDHRDVLAEKTRKLSDEINRFQKVNFISFLVSEGLIYSAVIVCLVIAAARLSSSRMSISDALLVLMLSYSYFSSIRQLMSTTHSALTAVSAAGKVEEIMEVDTSRPYDPSLPEDPQKFEGLRMEHVSFGYTGRDTALKDISLTVPKGKVTAIAGLSGCGKSTCASLLMRFLDPQSGHIYMESKDYLSVKPEDIRKHIVMVPQSVTVFSGTIRDNLLAARADATDEEMYEALRQVRLSDFARAGEKGLDSDAGDSGSRLSGGQKQKIGIARALLSNSEYIIFDEATSSVDPESEKEIRACIASLASVRTLIIISHRLSAIQNADCIYVLDHGTVRESGTHEELMRQNGLYAGLVHEQNEMEVSL